MFTIKSVFVSAAFIASLGSAAKAFANNSILVQAPVEKVFVPQGFDDNDKVEVVVHGHFPNTCYKMGPVSGTVDATRKKVTITASAYYYKGATCAQMMIPFIKSVELRGTVPVGNYKIEVINRPSAEAANLAVAKATRNEADDYLYAAVQSAAIEEKATGDFEVVLKGQHPHLFQGCVKFQKIKTTLTPENVVVLQPITYIENDDNECIGAVATSRFEYRAPLSYHLNRGEYVLHVRALNGNSVNEFVSFE